MKSNGLIAVFPSGVFVAGHSNAPKIVYLPPTPPLSAGGPVFA